MILIFFFQKKEKKNLTVNLGALLRESYRDEKTSKNIIQALRTREPRDI